MYFHVISTLLNVFHPCIKSVSSKSHDCVVLPSVKLFTAQQAILESNFTGRPPPSPGSDSSTPRRQAASLFSTLFLVEQTSFLVFRFATLSSNAHASHMHRSCIKCCILYYRMAFVIIGKPWTKQSPSSSSLLAKNKHKFGECYIDFWDLAIGTDCNTWGHVREFLYFVH